MAQAKAHYLFNADSIIWTGTVIIACQCSVATAIPHKHIYYSIPIQLHLQVQIFASPSTTGEISLETVVSLETHLLLVHKGRCSFPLCFSLSVHLLLLILLSPFLVLPSFLLFLLLFFLVFIPWWLCYSNVRCGLLQCNGGTYQQIGGSGSTGTLTTGSIVCRYVCGFIEWPSKR